MKYRIPGEVRYIMGHTRMTTQGNANENQNNHPFPGKAGRKQSIVQDLYCRGIKIKPKLRIVVDGQRIFTLNKIDIVILIQNCKGKATLYLLIWTR